MVNRALPRETIFVNRLRKMIFLIVFNDYSMGFARSASLGGCVRWRGARRFTTIFIHVHQFPIRWCRCQASESGGANCYGPRGGGCGKGGDGPAARNLLTLSIFGQTRHQKMYFLCFGPRFQLFLLISVEFIVNGKSCPPPGNYFC